MVTASSIKHVPKATYEDFVHSMTDRPWFFSFFFDLACRIAQKKGIKDDFQKEEFAIVAIEHLWSNLDKFDPSRAEFSSYFNICIGNKILDQIDTSKRDGVFGLDKPLREDIENCGDSVSDEENDKLLKKKEFADKLVCEFKKFIDTLSPEKRLIFCASEFGKIAMGKTPSGRNYAEQIAVQTGRTAATIRKIVERLKKESIGYIQERGFDYDTYSTHIGFITTKPKEDKTDFSALDWCSLTGVQRLKLRMYLYGKAVSDGLFTEETFDNY